MFFVYIIQSTQTGAFYIGSTSDLEDRLWHHNNNLTASTKKKGPWKVVYQETHETKKSVLQREHFLKKQKNRAFYEKLINGT
ncbi:GIY-YIG nuclease family protein [Candidatus Roizmanbacteria bacterium]|nr:GIY-YIG nuclease family protein [Candidatus Roizmanbacteria bacterium]